MRVLFVALGTAEEACSRVRIHQYLPFLASRGVHATVVPFYPRAPRVARPARPPGAARRLAHALYEVRRILAVARLARAHDVVVVQRILPHPALQRLLARHCRVLLFDFDDAIYTTHAGATTAVPHARERFARLLSLADAAIASTPYLAAAAAPHCARVVVIPSPVDCERYQPRPRADASPGEVTIGWIGRDSTTMYLAPLLPVLARLAAAHPGLRVRLVGAVAGTGAGVAECVPWSLDTELDQLARFDIGIMPLSDDAWARGKGGYKLLQYLACGIPAVASPVGANPVLIAHGETGFLAQDATGWQRHLAMLIEDPELRRRMGAAGRRAVEAEQSLAVWAPRFLGTLEEVAATATRTRGLASRHK